MLLQSIKYRDIDRNPVPFDFSSRRHRPTAKQGAWQIDDGQHGRQQPRQGRDIAFAIVENCAPFGVRPWSATQNEGAHVLLLSGADGIQSEMSESTQQA